MRKSIIRTISFFTILILVIHYINNILKYKSPEGIAQITNFYEQSDNSIDVIILGTSHSFVNFNNGTLFDEFGIASYNLGGAVQPIWNSYYLLKEALKTQTPELIILEGHSLSTVINSDYSDEKYTIRNIFGMKYSPNKIEDILISSEPSQSIDFILEYPHYHTRYSLLDAGDFVDVYGSKNREYNWYGAFWKGQFLFEDANIIELTNNHDTVNKEALFPRTEEYYRKILELAQSKNIPVIVVIAPYKGYEYDQGRYLAANDIASEYNVDFYDCNLHLNEINFNPSTDFHDDVHMTIYGSKIFSEYIGSYINDNYTISDRRNNPNYISWKNHATYINQYIHDLELHSITNIDSLTEYLSNPTYWIIISSDGNIDLNNDTIKNLYSSIGIDTYQANGINLIQSGNVIWHSNEIDSTKYFMTKYHDIYLRYDPVNNNNTIVIDGNEPKRVANGINITIYNPMTNIIIDELGIDSDNHYQIVR